jgi:hypothetical protein
MTPGIGQQPSPISGRRLPIRRRRSCSHRPPPHRPPGDRPPKPTHPIARPPGDCPPGGGGPSGGRPVQLPSDGNLYDRLPGRESGDLTRPATREVKGKRPAGKPANLPNNVYTDRDGNIFRRTDSGWEQRQGNQWTRPAGDKASGPANRPATLQPAGGSSWNNRQQSLQRDANSRNRGRQRTQQYQRSHQRQPSRSAASRGGGGRRR